MMIVKIIHRFNSILKIYFGKSEFVYSHLDQFALNPLNKSNNQLCALLSNQLFNRNYVAMEDIAQLMGFDETEDIVKVEDNAAIDDYDKAQKFENVPIVEDGINLLAVGSKEEDEDEDEELNALINEHEKLASKSATNSEEKIDIEKIGEVVVNNDDGNLEIIETIKSSEIETKIPILFPKSEKENDFAALVNLKKKKGSKSKLQNNMFLLNNTSKLNAFNKWLLNQKPLDESNTPNIIKLNKRRKKLTKLKKLEKITLPSLETQTTIVSESLAKILAKQGYITEALDMYKQLSLNIPEKSDYFASQIEELKKR